MRTVLVVGARGRIGGALLARLQRAEGIRVVAAARSPLPDGTPTVLVDLADPPSLRRAVLDVRPDAVVHLAGLTGAACEASPSLVELVNVTAPLVVREASSECGADTMVFPSTSAVYGDRYDGAAGEDDGLDCRSAYAASKLAAERALVSSWRASAGTVPVLLRPFNVFGPGFDDSLVEKLRRSSVDGSVVLRGWQGFARDYVHVSDVVDVVSELVARPVVHEPTTLNVGSGRSTSNAELVGLLSRRHDLRWTLEDGPESRTQADCTRLATLLGWSPSLRPA